MATPPGWYPDPSGGSGSRYWDGERWSEYRSTHEPCVSKPYAPGFENLAKVNGYIYILGLGIASAAATALVQFPASKPFGFAIIITAVIFMAVWPFAVAFARGYANFRAATPKAATPPAHDERKSPIVGADSKEAELKKTLLAAEKQIISSEAARDGWLGEVDFTASITAITENFRKARDLRKDANQLSKLDHPGDEDRAILADARATATKLEDAALEQVKLIVKCATEARLIDESLRKERADARTAEERARLHVKLTSKLYEIDATKPGITNETDSAIDAVMARVQAYREIKNQIQGANES